MSGYKNQHFRKGWATKTHNKWSVDKIDMLTKWAEYSRKDILKMIILGEW